MFCSQAHRQSYSGMIIHQLKLLSCRSTPTEHNSLREEWPNHNNRGNLEINYPFETKKVQTDAQVETNKAKPLMEQEHLRIYIDTQINQKEGRYMSRSKDRGSFGTWKEGIGQGWDKIHVRSREREKLRPAKKFVVRRKATSDRREKSVNVNVRRWERQP